MNRRQAALVEKKIPRKRENSKVRVSPEQQDIRTERDRLRAILNSMEDGIYIVGRDLRIEFMNLVLRSEMGNGEGRFCYEFFGHEPSTCEHCQHGMGSFGPELRRDWYVAASGKTYDVSIAPIHDPTGSISRLHILRDITERKVLEGQLHEYSEGLEAKVAEQTEKLLRQERLVLLGEIAAGLAHEIRTPLGAIITGIRLLEKGGQKPGNQELIFGLLNRETARLERKVSEFLAYAKPRLPRLEPTSIAELFHEVEEILSTDSKLLGEVDFDMFVQPDVPPWDLDADQMKEVLLNLCVNALQSLQGKGRLSLEAKCQEELLEIFVRDNGPGIPLDTLPHVFRPFYSRKAEGTGLGLSICKEIIEGHGGRITVASLPHRHTTFRIALPRKEV